MDAADASSLIAYINGHNSRYIATALVCDGQTWVLVRDSQAGRFPSYIKPILYIHTYLEQETTSSEFINDGDYPESVSPRLSEYYNLLRQFIHQQKPTE